MAERGGSRTKGVDRPDPLQGPWAELVALLYDRLYEPAGMPSKDEIARRATGRRTKISSGMAYAILTLRRNPEWPTFKALVMALDGNPTEWEPRWEQAKRRAQHERQSGKAQPLPGVDEGKDTARRPEGVGDWDRWRLSRRAWRRLRRTVLVLLAVGIAVAPAVLGPRRWWWVTVAAVAVVSMAALRRRHRAGRSRQQRQIILEIFRDHASYLLASYRDSTRIEPRFVRIEQPPPASRHGTRRRRGNAATDPQTPDKPYPEGTTVLELFEDAAQTLALISEPGMGKTTQMALLFDELARRALTTPRGERAVLPIMVNLSTYRGQPFEDWLAGEIHTRYDINLALVRGLLGRTIFGESPESGNSTRGFPRAASRTGGSQAYSEDQEADDVLLLLDGLDEIPKESHRRECAEHIHELRQRCVGLVLGCRSRDYKLARRINAVRYVLIDEPDRPAVHRYLATNGEALADVRAALKSDPSLWKLLQSPLMLQVITHTYAGRPAAELRQPGSVKERQRRIFDAYIRRMLDHRPTPYPHHKTVTWLTWLARTLTLRGEQIFYLDRLDHTWAASPTKAANHQSSPALTFAGVFAGAFVGISAFAIGAVFDLLGECPFRGPLARWDALRRNSGPVA